MLRKECSKQNVSQHNNGHGRKGSYNYEKRVLRKEEKNKVSSMIRVEVE